MNITFPYQAWRSNPYLARHRAVPAHPSPSQPARLTAAQLPNLSQSQFFFEFLSAQKVGGKCQQIVILY